MFLSRLRYEIRVMGKWAILLPLLCVGGVVLLTLLYRVVVPQLSSSGVNKLLTGCLEMALPLLAALIVSMISSRDPAQELQLTLPHNYYNTAFLRLCVVVLWSACIGCIFFSVIYSLHLWRIPRQIQAWQGLAQFFTGQLVWAAPLLWLVGATLFLTLLLRSRAASSGLVGAFWIFQSFLYQTFVSNSWLQPIYLFPTTMTPAVNFWLLNRFELLGTAVVFLLLSWVLLHDSETLVQGTGGEEV